MTAPVLGLDIGGANIKAAHSDGTARSVPFSLWKHPERLPAGLAGLCATMPPHDRLAVTMTGELCDCFETKREGVLAILQSVRDIATGASIHVWCTRSRFLTTDEAKEDTRSVAAANWLAEAHLVARLFSDERILLIDTGSTTTDLVYLNSGVPQPRGLTDPQRLESGELVYTGVRRTPMCAVLGMEVAAELFATMQDAYVFAGLLPEAAEDRDTADGRPTTRRHAHARLARMRCADVENFTIAEAGLLANRALHVQWRAVAAAVERVLQGRLGVERVVIAGSGEVLGRSVAVRVDRLNGVRVTSLAESLGPDLSQAACAYAVAWLAANEE